MRIATSPLLGFGRRIDSMRNPLAMLGMEKLECLMMAASLRDFLSPALQAPGLRDARLSSCPDHSREMWRTFG